MIKKLIFISMAVLCLILPCTAQDNAAYVKQEKIDVVFFTSPYCGFCKRCAAEFIPGFIEANKDRINFIEHNVFEEGKNAIFYDAVKEYGQQSSGVPAMVIGDHYFLGYPHQIGSAAQMALDDAIAKGQKTRVRKLAVATPKPRQEAVKKEPAPAKKTAVAKVEKKPEPKKEIKKEAPLPIVQKEEIVIHEDASQNVSPVETNEPDAPSTTKSIFESITLWAIVGAGLVDGINPCAFAVIVFFISFLAVYKYEKREIMIVGICYCASVFVAYILMGLGLFNFLYAMGSFYYAIVGFKWLTIILCGIFFLLSVYDLLAYKITGRADKIILQLPKSYKEYVHKVMRFFLKDKEKSTLRLIMASVAVGFIVSLVEAVCTGQVYLPTIVLILKEADSHFWRAISYLLIYNFMFIVPLIVIFVLTLLGYESKGFNDFLKKHLALTKFLLALVFLVLLILLITAM
ncbi:Cytochrome c biogenesis protein CcdA [Parelusimicrobium proximum]|uniref:hypothetical protein n=1 Tax=Parelusimicrobium proximum TaxID=3228953 RepID=UPI003D1834FC